jgi:hypothetical protein
MPSKGASDGRFHHRLKVFSVDPASFVSCVRAGKLISFTKIEKKPSKI